MLSHTFIYRLGDDVIERRTRAEALLDAYNRELERRRLAAGAQGLLISGIGEIFFQPFSYVPAYLPTEDYYDEDDDDDDDEEFHYPGSSPVETTRPASIRSSGTDYFTRSSTPRGPTDLTPHLSQAPDFRVPTHEAPQKVLTPRWTPPVPHQIHAQWERDEEVTQCRECRRRFGFLTRRVCSICFTSYMAADTSFNSM